MNPRTIHKFRPIPGLSREAEERQLAEIIRIAQDNLEKAEKSGEQLADELQDLMETFGTKDKESIALFHNTQSQLRENQRDLIRYRKARTKPYFGRIDFKDPKIPYAESYYVGRVGISKDSFEPVVIDWRAPIASVYYENNTGYCRYTVKNEGICEIDLKRKRTYEIADDRLVDFFDSDVVANDELLTKYLARNKSAVLGEIIATIQKEQNAVIRRSPKMNLIVQGVAGSGKTTVAMHRISYILYNYEEEFCRSLERAAIPQDSICLENGILIMSRDKILDCLENNPLVSMQGKINMLNAILRSKLENEMSGKSVTYPLKVKKEILKKYSRHFGKGVWKGSVFEVYREFLDAQDQNGKRVPYSENNFDLYDLAALAYIYKRIKETDGIREASHVIIDEAQDFGMMAYGALSYCLRNCTYTIMGDVSQNIHYGYGLNDWEDLKKLMLRGISSGFGVLKKSYRNTVEISDFATGILRHGNFPVYPVDPIERHGNPVCVTGCSDESDMIRKTAEMIRKWQADGRETIAVICRDETAASRVSEALSSDLKLADSNLETAEFTEGIMVLPVEYTKGLEFDAVVLYDPSEKNYPSEDGYVKLLYVAATRALHELAVIHAGDLTDLIAKPVPQEKHLQVLDTEENKPQVVKGNAVAHQQPAEGGTVTHPQAAENTAVTHPQAAGASGKGTGAEISRRRFPGSGQGSKKTLNPSPYPFGSIPDSRILTRQEPCSADLSIRDIKRTEKDLDLISRQGILRLTPESEDVIRVRFVSREVPTSGPGAWNFLPDKSVPWTARAGKSLVELSTTKITVQIDKRSGALRFLSRDGRRLLTEKTALPRRVEGGKRVRTWEYFDWQKEEKLSAKGILAEDLERMDHKARYISFGGKRLRMPLLVSKYRYGLGIAAEETVLCCNIPMYGTYLYTEGPGQIDYYFIYGEDYSRILELYQKIQ